MNACPAVRPSGAGYDERVRLTALLIVVLVALLAPFSYADGPASPRTPADRARLLHGLASEAAAERERAYDALRGAQGLTAEEVRAALASGGARDLPLLLQLIGTHELEGLTKDVVALLDRPEPRVSEAAIRAVVRLGDDAVRAGIKQLSPRLGREPEAGGVVRRLMTLHAQSTIEKALLAKWRRKGGSYLGRYSDLQKYRWALQPVLLAMLLDVPLEERFVVLPGVAESPLGRFREQRAALDAVVRSPRRGYRTFDPLPLNIQQDELFDLASQALIDTANMNLIGDILEGIAFGLKSEVERIGWRANLEDALVQDLELILSARGRHELLDRRISEERRQVRRYESRLQRNPNDADFQYRYSIHLGDLARALHGRQLFDEAASVYAEHLRIATIQGGTAPPIASYNRACALARAGRIDEALVQLDKALALGVDDLSREWVSEDGDLHSLHEDPRFETVIAKYYGEE